MDPRPLKYVAPTTPEADLTLAPEPVVIYGVPSGGGGGGGDVASVNGKTGTVVLNASDVGAAPTNHTQAISTITGLQAELDSKATPGQIPDPSDFATAAQGAKADTAVQPAAISNFVPNTRTVAGKPLSANVDLTKVDVGLASVDNTSDVNKPISTAAQMALDLKVPTTRTVAGKALSANVTLVKGDVGLGLVDNTSDASKPVSTAQAAAISAKVGSANSSVTGIEYYSSFAALPGTGVAGVIYVVPSV